MGQAGEQSLYAIGTPSAMPWGSMVKHRSLISLNLTYQQEKRLLSALVRVTRKSVLLGSLPPDHRQHSIQLIRLHKNVTCLGTLARSHDGA